MNAAISTLAKPTHQKRLWMCWKPWKGPFRKYWPSLSSKVKSGHPKVKSAMTS